MQDEKPLAVTFKRAGSLAGLGQTKLWELAKEKRIETVRVGRRRLILYRSLEKLFSPQDDA